MSISSNRWSRLALCGVAVLLMACSEEDPLISGGSRLPRATPEPTATPSAKPTATPTEAPTPTPAPTLKSLLIVPSELSLSSDPGAPPSSRGASLTAIAVLTNDQQLSTTAVAWTAAPAGRLTINQSGYVSAMANAPTGTVTVTASSGSIQATASVRVTGTSLTVAGVTVSSAGLTLYAPATDGQNTAGLPTTAQLAAEVTMSDASTTSAVTWSSSNEAVARVSASGLVTSVGAGNATIRAAATQDPAKSVDCPIVVKAQGLVDVTVE